MPVLAIDTAFNPCGVALADQGRVLGEFVLDTAITHSGRLAPQVGALLDAAGVGKADLTGLALSIGPGFFTGLRIGLSFGLGLALALSLPVAPVSSLRLLAAGAASAPGDIWAVADARRGLVYAGRFRFDGRELKREIDDLAASPQRLAQLLEPPALLVGGGARVYAEELVRPGITLAPAWQETPRPGLLALLGESGLAAGAGLAPEMIAPRYCRPSDAEIRFGLPLEEYNLLD